MAEVMDHNVQVRTLKRTVHRCCLLGCVTVEILPKLRLLGLLHLQGGGFMCAHGLWEWDDPELCERSKQIIPRLLKKINKFEDEKKARLSKVKNPWFWVSVLLF
ncbi:unnamed protein product [Prunus brigantina]